jgi:hypothetical protein
VLDWVLEFLGWSAASRYKRALVRLAVVVAVGMTAAVVAVLLGK